MGVNRKVDNLLALAVLSYLSDGPKHPYEVSRLLRAHDDVRSIKFNHSSIYMVFGRLNDAGLIAAEQTEREGRRPERTTYALTAAGHAELREWLRALVAEPRHEYPQFVAALSLIGALHPDEATELLRARATRLTERRAEIVDLLDRTRADGLHPLFTVEEEYRLALLDAESAFVDGLLERIGPPGWWGEWAEHHTERHHAMQGDPMQGEEKGP